MAARYCLYTLHFHNATSGKDETVPAGSQRDSASAAVTQNPSAFTSSPLTTAQLHPNVVEFLKINPAGP